MFKDGTVNASDHRTWPRMMSALHDVPARERRELLAFTVTHVESAK